MILGKGISNNYGSSRPRHIAISSSVIDKLHQKSLNETYLDKLLLKFPEETNGKTSKIYWIDVVLSLLNEICNQNGHSQQQTMTAIDNTSKFVNSHAKTSLEKCLSKKQKLSYDPSLWSRLIDLWDEFQLFVRQIKVPFKKELFSFAARMQSFVIDLTSVTEFEEENCKRIDLLEGLAFLDGHCVLPGYSEDLCIDALLRCRALYLPAYRKPDIFLPLIGYVVNNLKPSLEIKHFLRLILLVKLMGCIYEEYRSQQMLQLIIQMYSFLRENLTKEFFAWAQKNAGWTINLEQKVATKKIVKHFQIESTYELLYPSEGNEINPKLIDNALKCEIKSQNDGGEISMEASSVKKFGAKAKNPAENKASIVTTGLHESKPSINSQKRKRSIQAANLQGWTATSTGDKSCQNKEKHALSNKHSCGWTVSPINESSNVCTTSPLSANRPNRNTHGWIIAPMSGNAVVKRKKSEARDEENDTYSPSTTKKIKSEGLSSEKISRKKHIENPSVINAEIVDAQSQAEIAFEKEKGTPVSTTKKQVLSRKSFEGFEEALQESSKQFKNEQNVPETKITPRHKTPKQAKTPEQAQQKTPRLAAEQTVSEQETTPRQKLSKKSKTPKQKENITEKISGNEEPLKTDDAKETVVEILSNGESEEAAAVSSKKTPTINGDNSLSDLEVLEEKLVSRDFNDDSQDYTECDEASGSEGDIVPNDDNNSMFSKEENKAFYEQQLLNKSTESEFQKGNNSSNRSKAFVISDHENFDLFESQGESKLASGSISEEILENFVEKFSGDENKYDDVDNDDTALELEISVENSKLDETVDMFIEENESPLDENNVSLRDAMSSTKSKATLEDPKGKAAHEDKSKSSEQETCEKPFCNGLEVNNSSISSTENNAQPADAATHLQEDTLNTSLKALEGIDNKEKVSVHPSEKTEGTKSLSQSEGNEDNTEADSNINDVSRDLFVVDEPASHCNDKEISSKIVANGTDNLSGLENSDGKRSTQRISRSSSAKKNTTGKEKQTPTAAMKDVENASDAKEYEVIAEKNTELSLRVSETTESPIEACKITENNQLSFRKVLDFGDSTESKAKSTSKSNLEISNCGSEVSKNISEHDHSSYCLGSTSHKESAVEGNSVLEYENKENIMNNKQIGEELEVLSSSIAPLHAETENDFEPSKQMPKSPSRLESVSYLSPKKSVLTRKRGSSDGSASKSSVSVVLTPLKVASAALNSEILISPEVSDEENASHSQQANVEPDSEDIMHYIPDEKTLLKSSELEEEQATDICDNKESDSKKCLSARSKGSGRKSLEKISKEELKLSVISPKQLPKPNSPATDVRIEKSSKESSVKKSHRRSLETNPKKDQDCNASKTQTKSPKSSPIVKTSALLSNQSPKVGSPTVVEKSSRKSLENKRKSLENNLKKDEDNNVSKKQTKSPTTEIKSPIADNSSPTSSKSDNVVVRKSPRLSEKKQSPKRASESTPEVKKDADSSSLGNNVNEIDSEERDKLSSPVKKCRLMLKRLGVTDSPDTSFLNSPRRRRDSLTSIKNDDVSETQSLVGSPVRPKKRRNSLSGNLNLTPVRRSRRISGVAISPLKEEN